MTSHSFISWEDAVSWLIEQPEYHVLARECYFDRPVEDAVKRYLGSDEWREIRDTWLPIQSRRALDVGAGNGIVSYALAKDGWRVTALEPDPSKYVGAEAIRSIAVAEALPIEVIEEYGENIPLKSNSFDLIMARQVMHHAIDLNGMYLELARVLRPKGRLIAFRDHVVDSKAGLSKFQNSHPLHRLYGGENAFQDREYERAIKNAGLVIVKKLRHFDSVINFGPRSKDEIRNAISRLGIVGPGRRLVRRVIESDAIFQGLLSLISRLDRRQGRLVSYICEKPSPP